MVASQIVDFLKFQLGPGIFSHEFHEKMVVYAEVEKYGIIQAVYLKFVFLYWPEYPRITPRSLKIFGCPAETPVGCHTTAIQTHHCSLLRSFFILYCWGTIFLPWLTCTHKNFVTFSVIGSFSIVKSINTQLALSVLLNSAKDFSSGKYLASMETVSQTHSKYFAHHSCMFRLPHRNYRQVVHRIIKKEITDVLGTISVYYHTGLTRMIVYLLVMYIT